jgi:hypothetical protein
VQEQRIRGQLLLAAKLLLSQTPCPWCMLQRHQPRALLQLLRSRHRS